jgi:hypothetical protein
MSVLLIAETITQHQPIAHVENLLAEPQLRSGADAAEIVTFFDTLPVAKEKLMQAA